MSICHLSKLTLRDAFRLFYLPELKSSGGSRGTIDRNLATLNRWERHTANPSIDRITNETLSEFRTAIVDAKLSPATFNTMWRTIRAILRRLGPQETRNPQGMGLIARIPYVTMLRENLGQPRRVEHDEIDAFYQACEQARWPHCLVPAAEWWRAAVVLAYNTGPRRNDLFGLRTADIELDRDPCLRYTQIKTGKSLSLPLNETATAHIKGIWSQRPMLFPAGEWIVNGSRAYQHEWRRLQDLAGVRFTIHDLRRTCGSAFADVAGLEVARTVLGHRPTDVTVRFYVSFDNRLRKAARELPQPPSFRAVKHYVVPPPIRRTDWRFVPGAALYREIVIRLPRRPLAVLQALVGSGRPVGFEDLARVAFWDKPDIDLRTVKGAVHRLRDVLSRALRLPESHDCLPWDRFGDRGWALVLPAEANIGRRMSGDTEGRP